MMTLILIIDNMNIDIDIIDISDHLNGDIGSNINININMNRLPLVILLISFLPLQVTLKFTLLTIVFTAANFVAPNYRFDLTRHDFI